MTFKELKITEPVLKAVEEKGYEMPTPIQQQTIPVAIEGRDVLGIAQTGTGKTAAFAIPIIEQLRDDVEKFGHKQIKALVVTPTRELAIQIDESFQDYGKYTDVRHVVIFGGVNQAGQVKQLRQGTDVLVATPGRLLDLINQKIINLKFVKHFVLDEADRMLDMGFIHDIRKLLPLLPPKKQTMLFSATMPSEIANISKKLLQSPVRIEVTPEASVVDTIGQKVCFVEKPDKLTALVSIIKEHPEDRVLVFSRTKHGADNIARKLSKRHVMCGAIHGNKSQNARQKALNDFKSGSTKVIIATDIAARGIDIEHLEVVVNFDLPDVPETYVHRIGRTGRAGHEGVAFTLCSQAEFPMLKSIQKLTGKKLNEVDLMA